MQEIHGFSVLCSESCISIQIKQRSNSSCMAFSPTYSSITSRLFFKVWHLVLSRPFKAPFLARYKQPSFHCRESMRCVQVSLRFDGAPSLTVDIHIGVFICTTNLALQAACCFAQLQGKFEPKVTLSGQRIIEVKIITYKNESGSASPLQKHFSCATAQPISPAVWLHPPLSYSS